MKPPSFQQTSFACQRKIPDSPGRDFSPASAKPPPHTRAARTKNSISKKHTLRNPQHFYCEIFIETKTKPDTNHSKVIRQQNRAEAAQALDDFAAQFAFRPGQDEHGFDFKRPLVYGLGQTE